MANKKIQIIPPDGGYVDVLHPETSADMVIMNDGINVEQKISAHLADKVNPHGVTKAQVQLGSVLNYGIATQAEAEAGTSNAKYMTPLRVAEAIDSLGAKVVNGSYVGDGNNRRDINVGFAPKIAFIYCNFPDFVPYLGIVTPSLDNSIYLYGNPDTIDAFWVKLTSNGFQVASNGDFNNKNGANENGITYYYTVIKG